MQTASWTAHADVRRTRAAWLLLGTGLFAAAVQALLAPATGAGVVQLVVVLAAIATVATAILRHRRDADAVEWFALATMIAWLLQGLVFWQARDAGEEDVRSHAVVVVSSLAYLPLFAGFALWCRRHLGDRRAYMLLLDASLLGAALSFAVWTLWIDPTPAVDEQLLDGDTILAIQVLMDIVLVTMLVGFLVVTRSTRVVGLWALVVGTVSLTLSDLNLVHAHLNGTYVPGDVADVGWTVFGVMLAFAFVHPSLQRLRLALGDVRRSASYRRQLTVLAAVAAAWIGVALVADHRGTLDTFALAVTGAVALAAVLAKMALLVLNLDAATARQRGVLDGVPTAIVLVEANGRVTAVNRAAETLIGLVPGDILGAPLDELVDRTVEDGRVEDEELRLVGRDGRERVVQASLGRTLDTGERVLALVDVTERHAMQQQVGHAQRLELIGRLAGGVAHDFNNSLLAIRATAEEALERREEAVPALAEIIRTTDMSRDVVDQLLAFSRGSAIDLKPVDATAAMEEVFGLAAGLIGRSITARFLADGPSIVLADRGTLQQAVLNLIVNARDAMPDGGELELRVRRVATTVEIAVADTGHGMDEDVRRQAILPFFSTKSDEGTGLGLAMVHGTVESLGGELALDSTAGAGTTVRICLPLADVRPAAAPVAATPTGEPEPAPPAGGATPAGRAPSGDEAAAALAGRHVLLVDDDERILDLVAKMLTRLGARVRATTDPREVATLVQDGPLDVLVTDLTMPDVDGGEVARIVRATHPESGVVLMSGFNPAEVEILASLGERSAFLRKPFARAGLVDALVVALGATTDDA